jgi:tRNA 2-selenouridine synthase
VEAFLAAAGPLIDLRSPAEFARGHIPGATNLPLFDNDERAEIGTLYKQQGRQAAVLQGLALVGPRMVSLGAALLAALAEHRSASSTAAQPHNAPCLRLHCWRGGMRSGSVAWLAGQLDLPVLLLGGGLQGLSPLGAGDLRAALAPAPAGRPHRLRQDRTAAGPANCRSSRALPE